MASRGAAANATLGLVLVALLLLSKDSHALGTGTGAIDSPGPVAQVQPGGGSIASAPTTSRLPQVRGANATAPTAQPKLPMYGVTEGSLKPQECSGRCSARCSATQYKKPCLFFCNKCCATCLCVPPGTYGNKQFCPCYNNWKTKRGGPKCP